MYTQFLTEQMQTFAADTPGSQGGSADDEGDEEEEQAPAGGGVWFCLDHSLNSSWGLAFEDWWLTILGINCHLTWYQAYTVSGQGSERGSSSTATLYQTVTFSGQGSERSRMHVQDVCWLTQGHHYQLAAQL